MGTFNCKSYSKTHIPIMSVVVVLGGTIKAEKVADFKAYCAEAIPKTKAQAGCEWVKVLVDSENPASVAIFQNWKDEAAQQAYAESVKAEGKLAEVIGTIWKPEASKNEFSNHTPHK